MADSVHAHFLIPSGSSVGGAGLVPAPGAAMDEEGQPAVLWGQGTPDGNLAPFNLVNKGTLYMEVNGTDDQTHIWLKVDEAHLTGSADWARILVENHALIDTSDMATAAGILIEQLEVNARVTTAMWGDLVDISAADSEQVVFHAVASVEITELGILWEEATGASGAAEGDITIGTATGGAEIVAATSYIVSKATGAYDALSAAEFTLAAGDSVFMSHDQAAGAAGTYRLVAKYYLVS